DVGSKVLGSMPEDTLEDGPPLSMTRVVYLFFAPKSPEHAGLNPEFEEIEVGTIRIVFDGNALFMSWEAPVEGESVAPLTLSRECDRRQLPVVIMEAAAELAGMAVQEVRTR